MPRLAVRRTGSGRATRGSVRRKLKASEPGAAVIIEEGDSLGSTRIGATGFTATNIKSRKTTTRYKGGAKGRKGSLLHAGVRIDATMGVDLDMRKLAAFVQSALAFHVKDAHRRGVTPDTGAPLPKLHDATLKRYPDRRGGYGVNTGKLLSMWGQSAPRGTVMQSSAGIKPASTILDRGRSIFINDSLRRGVDFGSTAGNAARVIQIAVDEYMKEAITDANGIVFTPRGPERWSGWKPVAG